MLSRSSRLALGLVLLALFAARGPAQDVEIRELETEFLDKKLRATSALRTQLFKGDVAADPNNKEHQNAIDVAAKDVTYRLFWQWRAIRPTKSGAIPEIFQNTVYELEDKLRRLSRNKDRGSVAMMQQLYSKAVIDRAADVIRAKDGAPIAAVNAARMIAMIPARRPGTSLAEWTAEVTPRLTGGNADALLTLCADLVAAPKNKVNDGVRYYALKAAGDVLALPRQPTSLVKGEAVEKAVLAAVGVATRKETFPKAAPRGEVEGFKILRAEALRVVAWTPAPVLGKERPALVLARAAGNDASLDPPVRLEEQLEAAIGLGRLVANGAKLPDLNADYAAHQVAYAVGSFGAAADANREKKASARLRTWKIDAARLLEAVERMAVNKDPHVAKVVAECRTPLINMEKGDVSNGAGILTWASGNPPESRSLLKNAEDSVVKHREAAGGE